jgi:type II secretory pathway component PulJ
MIRKNSQNGYSLMELVVYIALFAMLSIVMTRSLITVMRTYASAKTYRTLQTNGELVMERVAREIREATTITSATYDSSPGALALSGIDSTSAVHTASFSVSSGVIQINDNGTTTALSTSDVTVSSLIFRHMTTAGGGHAIKIELTLTTNRGNIASASFYDTIFLRGQ